MSYNTKNYTKQGGEESVINGTLIFKGKEISCMENIAAVTDAPTKEQFNALLTALKNAGLMTADT